MIHIPDELIVMILAQLSYRDILTNMRVGVSICYVFVWYYHLSQLVLTRNYTRFANVGNALLAKV